MDSKELKDVLKSHRLWLTGVGGEQADLRDADLSHAYLSYADLSYADLSYADLRRADLSYADLRRADLSHAYLSHADLSYADLSYADLRWADLSHAYLSHADLSHAYLSHADLTDLVIWSTIGNNAVIKSVHCDTYDIAYTDKFLQICCERHLIKNWWKFDNERILEMDGKKALKWWKVWKPIIRKIIKYSPADNNGFNMKALDEAEHEKRDR